ncbi:hypothetical protein Pla175_45980 [Pirellulimonas nuda]|uniref:Uncharacterized protein n=1 Tax=Pirellulimonas nuda TaxID=2528009 RepID=A0A518DI66_9BACT|nr:hypothetical protein [Pirellulimonas nuda]QDU91178.1 hypothetical protein Pla175_45980 [Pirellulimonas nuda]
MTGFSTTELDAFLDESLPADRMAAVEQAARDDAGLRDRLSVLVGQRDAGMHSLGAVWRRRRLTCPTREQLGSFLMGVLPAEAEDYTRFHLEVIGCRPCCANLADLQSLVSQSDTQQAEPRRRRYFQSSVGGLRAEDG